MRFVRNRAKPDWGFGVVAGEADSSLDILFEGVGHRRLSKSFAGLVEVLDTDVPAEHPLRDREKWPKLGRDAKRAEATRQLPARFDAFIKEFLEIYPGGLLSAECDAAERTYKVEASKFARKELDAAVLDDLSRSGEFTEIVQRARRALGKVNLAFANELKKFRDIPAPAHPAVAQAIVRLVKAGDETPRALEDFATALAPHGAAKWTIASLLPFLLDPARWPFVKPTFIERAATATNIDIEYDARPNARTYELIRDLYQHVATALGERGLAVRDFIDVQTFLWVASGMAREMRDQRAAKDQNR